MTNYSFSFFILKRENKFFVRITGWYFDFTWDSLAYYITTWLSFNASNTPDAIGIVLVKVFHHYVVLLNRFIQ